MKYCVVNADDFGMSQGINRGILEAHFNGIVTSTSLVVNMPFSEEAAFLSRDAPDLSVGLHINLTGESPDPIIALNNINDFWGEIDRQFQRFHELMNRPPTHLDVHQNVHREPRLLPFVLDLSRLHRLPLREYSLVRYFPNFYGYWEGETHLEQISVESLAQMLETEFKEAYTELSCHPGYMDSNFQSFYAIERETELRTLCDPRIRQKISELNIELINFRDIGVSSQ